MDNIAKILQILQNSGDRVGFSELKNSVEMHESTLSRNLEKLISSGEVYKQVSGKNTFYSLAGKRKIEAYLQQDFFLRPKVGYNPNFLRKYIPNTSSFLGVERYGKIKSTLGNDFMLSTYDYKSNIRNIENLLIDLSYASSKLEGNTYSYLDTEILIKYGESAEGKTAVETQMILNHKKVIKYIIDKKKNISYNAKTFFEIHSFLGKELLLDSYLGVIRNNPVKIGGSSYTPLESKGQLETEFHLFLEKLNEIKNPFEQSLFILVFIPYFQIFFDINKRTSRISCNIPLIQNGLPPMSLLQVSERNYIDAILAIYELNDTRLIADIFTNNYLLNLERYVD